MADQLVKLVTDLQNQATANTFERMDKLHAESNEKFAAALKLAEANHVELMATVGSLMVMVTDLSKTLDGAKRKTKTSESAGPVVESDDAAATDVATDVTTSAKPSFDGNKMMYFRRMFRENEEFRKKHLEVLETYRPGANDELVKNPKIVEKKSAEDKHKLMANQVYTWVLAHAKTDKTHMTQIETQYAEDKAQFNKNNETHVEEPQTPKQ